MPALSSMMVTEGSPALTRMVRAGEEVFHNTVLSKDEGSSQSTYEIIMVSLSGSLLLLAAIGAAISILRRRCISNYFSKDLSTPVVVGNVSVTNSSDKISTVDLTGPMCLSYISGKQSVSPESPISEETISISEFPFFSFAVSITTPAVVPEQ